MKRVIITGATGFIGFALTKKLVNLGVEVYAVIRPNSHKRNLLEKIENVKIIECDLSEILRLSEYIDQSNFDVFYHFAWEGVSGTDCRNLEIQIGNVYSACNAVRVAGSLGVKKFVYASSIMEYEVMKLMGSSINADARNIYRTAKLAAHYWTRIIANDIGLVYHAANISNVYGAGEYSSRFINLTIREMLKGHRVKFTEATQLYDFIYIDDAVELLCIIGKCGKANKEYYVGSMEPRVLKEFIYEMRDCIDQNLELGIGENLQYVGVSLEYTEFDMNICYREFGYTPKYSFKEGICKTIEWLKQNEKE